MMESLNASGLLSIRRTRISGIQSSSRSTNRSSFSNMATHKNQRSSIVLSISYIGKSYMGTVTARQGDYKVQASAATPGPDGSPWGNWLIGIILSLVLPFAHKKWGGILALKNKVDTVVHTAETVVETVEKVAEGVAHIADEVANQLPEGGALQNIVCGVAHAAEETAKDAHIVDEFIEKVEDMENELVSAIMGEAHETTTKVEDDGVTKDHNIQTEKEVEQTLEIDLEVPQDGILDDQPK